MTRQSLLAALRAAVRNFALVRVDRIGRPTGFPGASVEMREVSPAGRWYTRPSRYQMRSITKIDFGGAHELALAQIALRARRLRWSGSGSARLTGSDLKRQIAGA